uniref:Uncharacterized protein n=1 Tax=Siphoviridae sp. ctsMn4 TaxID=2826485 RepID=A0A8S5NKU0_9CAUD|nr:MAG TPA: hypothetical protein [Siphoviridae sp. ctsMn4]
MRGWFHHRYRPYFLFNYKIPPPYSQYNDGYLKPYLCKRSINYGFQRPSK